MKLLIKLERKIMDGDTVLKYLPKEIHVINPEKDFHTKTSKIPKEKLKNGKFTHEKDTYVIMDLSESEKIQSFKRGAQIITQKDAGIIIAKTGINKESKVLDAGAGTGSLAAHLSLVAKNVTTIEKLEAHLKTAKKNLDLYKNTKVIQADIYELELKEEFDVFTLDVPEPWNAIKTANKHLKTGGYLVTYCPQITQAQKVINSLPENFLHEETIELIERQWKITEKIVRPQTKDYQHTAFLSFIRKLHD